MFWFKSKKFHPFGKIHIFFIFNSSLEIKLHKKVNSLSTTHCSNLDKYFPDMNLRLKNLFSVPVHIQTMSCLFFNNSGK